jgi:hypothetical protein
MPKRDPDAPEWHGFQKCLSLWRQVSNLPQCSASWKLAATTQTETLFGFPDSISIITQRVKKHASTPGFLMIVCT